MTAARLKWFGWGREGEGMTGPERAFVLGRYREKFGEERIRRPSPSRPLKTSRCPRRASPRPPRWRRSARRERYDRAAHAYGKSYPDYVRALLGDFAVRAGRRRLSPRRSGDRGGDGLGRRRRRLAGPVRRRVERMRRRRASPRRRPQGAVTLDLRHLDRVLEVDKTSRAALHPRRRVRAGAGEPAEAARSDAAPFPAELRIFDARAAGSRRARAAISPASTRTSTISSKACAS